MNFSSIFRSYIKGKFIKDKSCFDILEYSFQELREHIEKQFEPWMTWNNRGRYEMASWNDNDTTTWKWQLDHIIPNSSFDYKSFSDKSFKECWSLQNLRPLSAKQNVEDGNRGHTRKLVKK